MKKVALFGGTSEGRALGMWLVRQGVGVRMHVATEYGESLVESAEGLEVTARRMDAAAMAASMREAGCACAVDATHPYAVEVTANLRDACRETGVPCLRLKRPESDLGGARLAASSAEAAALLDEMSGNVLLAVGSKELSAFTRVRDYQSRLFARVLPSPEVVAGCVELGFSGRNLICMQGPFTRELNEAMLRALDIAVLVTKDSGDAGGFREKLLAAEACGARVLVIRRPAEAEGLTWEELTERLCGLLSLPEETRPEGARSAPFSPGRDAPGEPALPEGERAGRAVPRFPLFIPLEGEPVLVVGGGAVAARRVKALLSFGAAVTVVSPELCPALEREQARFRWKRRRYDGDVSGYRLAVAATDDRAVNRLVGEDARRLGIPVSVADRKEESTFWFPAIARSGGMVAGLTSADGDHAAVKRTAERIRRVLEEL